MRVRYTVGVRLMKPRSTLTAPDRAVRGTFVRCITTACIWSAFCRSAFAMAGWTISVFQAATMNDKTLVRLLAENVAYQAAFKASALVLKDVLFLVRGNEQSRATAARCREVLSLVRGEFLALPAGFRNDLNEESGRFLRAKLAELLSQIESLLSTLETKGC